MICITDYNRVSPATRQGAPEPSPVGEGGTPQRWMRCHPIYTVLGIFKLKFEYHLTRNFLFVELFVFLEGVVFNFLLTKSGFDIIINREYKNYHI